MIFNKLFYRSHPGWPPHSRRGRWTHIEERAEKCFAWQTLRSAVLPQEGRRGAFVSDQNHRHSSTKGITRSATAVMQSLCTIWGGNSCSRWGGGDFLICFFKTKERTIGCFWDQCNVTALCGQKELWSKSISVPANISFLLHSGQGQFGRGSMEYIKCFYVGFSLSLRSSSSCDYQKSIPWVCTPTRTINNILSSKAQQCLQITGRGRQADLLRADPMQFCQGTDEVPATIFGLYSKYFKCFKCTNISFKFRQNNIL